MARHTIDLDRDYLALSNVMEFDHVVRVHDDGTVSDHYGRPWAPETYIAVDDDGQITREGEHDMIAGLRYQGWYPLRGYTGQYMYRGPIMHPSECIGRNMARDILSEPGLYVALVVETLDDDEDAAGWMVARYDGDDA